MPLDDSNFPQITDIDETTALLIRARGFIERGWCRLTVALSANGFVTGPTSGDAAAWCMYGSLFAAGVPQAGYSEHSAVLRLESAIGGENVCIFNNRQETVEPVLAAFDRAIAAGTQEH
jgi:hypothetical protein